MLKIGWALSLWLGASVCGVVMLTSQADADSARRVDRYGDPLPKGAIARLGTRRFRVDAEIEKLAFAPDGKTIAVRGNRGVWLLDAVSGKQLRRIDIISGAANPSIAFSPDGKRLIAPCYSAEKDRVRQVVRVWETASGRKLRESELNDARWVGWSADGRPLAAYLGKGEMRLRDVATGREKRFVAKNLPDLVRSKVCTCVVGKNILAASDGNGIIHIWDTANGKERCVLKSGGAYVLSLSLSANGHWLASLARDAGASWVCLWDTTTGLAVHRVAEEQKYLDEVVFAPDGQTLATVGTEDIRFWDTKTGRERSHIRTIGGTSRFAAFSPDGKTLATALRYSSRAIQLWDVTHGTRKPQPEGHSHRPDRPSFSPDGKRLATSSSWEKAIRIWNTATGEPLLCIRGRGGMHDCAFSANGRTLYSCNGDTLFFFDAASGCESHVLKIEDADRPKVRQSGLKLFLSDDCARLIVLSSDGGHREELITGWDVATRKQLFHRRRVKDFYAVSPDARMLVALHPALDAVSRERALVRMGKPIEQRMRLEDIATGEPLQNFPRPQGQTLPLTLSPDGRLLISDTLGPLPQAASGWGNTLRLWEVLTANELLPMPVPTNNGFMKATFSPDGRLLALSAPSTEILLWDVRRRKELHRFRDFGAQVTSLTFSPDGRRLVSGLSDSTLLVWDTAAVRGKERSTALDAASARRAWDDLAADARKAFTARWTLAAVPNQAVPLLRERLKPAQAADPQRLRRLLADLDSDQFAVRDKARRELAELSELAEPALRRILENKPTLEVRRRVEALLERLRSSIPPPKTLQALRAVAVLEDIGTPQAWRVLEQLALGLAEARLTREAKASLRRLNLRSKLSR